VGTLRLFPLAALLASPAQGQLRPEGPTIPDSYGYSLHDQGDAECSFSFVDISGTGTPLSFTPSGAGPSADDGGALLTLVVPFELYGQSVPSLVVSTNGYLAAASSLAEEAGGDFSNDEALPAVPDNAPGVPARILVLHEDLSGVGFGGVVYEQHFAACPRASEALPDGEACTIVQWSDWSADGGAEPFDLQAVLYHGSFQIVLQLQPGSAALPEGTIGIQNATATVASWYRPAPPIAASVAICLFEPRFPEGGPVADLEVSKADTLDAVLPGELTDYEIGVLNRGPSPVTGARVLDAPPAGLTDCSWTCVASPGSYCAPSGTGGIDGLVDLEPGGWADYRLDCTAGPTPANVSNTVTASVPTGVTDPDPTNNEATDLNPAGSGRVPDGALLPGPEVLRVERAGSNLVLSWGASCASSDADYEVYAGTLGDFDSHSPLTCATGGALGYTTPVPSGDHYYLVVPTNLLHEGSYGRTSADEERPASASACLVQAVAYCP
jgi:uncharacterized repeat protein (TIGR01451 family)